MNELFAPAKREAIFSHDKAYRYWLSIAWDDQIPAVNFLMLNPSIATAERNDPTVERCERRARQLGFGGLIVTNLFALVSTDPKALKAHPDPIGPANNVHILEAARQTRLTVCAWGQHGRLMNRAEEVIYRLSYSDFLLYYLKLSKDGIPCHPLYLGYDLKPKLWSLP